MLILSHWHDFFMLMGTACATLVGLMFVAASIGAGLFTAAHRNMLKVFITPTVIHFSALLFVCLLATVPSIDTIMFGAVVGIIGLTGIVFSCGVWLRIRTRYSTTTTLADQLWNASIPIAGYSFMATGALLSLTGSDAWPGWIAIGLCVLLLSGIRNAWAMTLWIAVQSK